MGNDYVMITNASIKHTECKVKEGEKEEVRVRLAIYSNEKNVKEFGIRESHKYCGCEVHHKRKRDIVEIDILIKKLEEDTIIIESYELKQSEMSSYEIEKQLMRQGLALMIASTFGLHINLSNSCIFLNTMNRKLKIFNYYVLKTTESEIKHLSPMQMRQELKNRKPQLFSHIDIYPNKSSNVFDIVYKIHFGNSISDYHFSIPIDMRSLYLYIIEEYGRQIAREIVRSRGEKDLSQLLAYYSATYSLKELEKLGLEYSLGYKNSGRKKF